MLLQLLNTCLAAYGWDFLFCCSVVCCAHVSTPGPLPLIPPLLLVVPQSPVPLGVSMAPYALLARQHGQWHEQGRVWLGFLHENPALTSLSYSIIVHSCFIVLPFFPRLNSCPQNSRPMVVLIDAASTVIFEILVNRLFAFLSNVFGINQQLCVA